MDQSTATDPAEFWERRRNLTPQPTTESNIEERAKNGGRHLVLLADIIDKAVLSAFDAELSALNRFDCLEPVPLRYLHVTVKVVGNVVENADAVGLSDEQETRIIEDVSAAVSGVEPFSVEFPRFNLFPSTVYAEVADDGRLAELNCRACDVPEIEVHDRDRDGFIPHATLGQFVADEDYDQMLDYLEANRSIDAGPAEIGAIELVALDLAERYPTFETIERFELS